jgi:uncharacterized Zn finger protein (UPF0148 family)
MKTRKEVLERDLNRVCESCKVPKNRFDSFKKGQVICKACQSKKENK